MEAIPNFGVKYCDAHLDVAMQYVMISHADSGAVGQQPATNAPGARRSDMPQVTSVKDNKVFYFDKLLQVLILNGLQNILWDTCSLPIRSGIDSGHGAMGLRRHGSW